VALAATFTKPRAEFLEAQAPVAIPGTGGVSSSVVENFNFRDIISFRRGYSHAMGTHNPDTGAFNTLVTSVMEGFNIMGVVTVDRVVARLASKHFIEPPPGQTTIPEPSILTIGSHIENLRIAGHRVTCKPNNKVLSDWGTYSEARDGCDPLSKTVEVEGSLICTSIFSELECDLKPVGNRIDIPEFGSLFFGEILITEAERKLTMIRFELGCSVQASGSGPEVGGNGSPVPPLGG
jgi:hypothetical protein